ncbi:MAG: hypothetical protein JWQ51_1575 [Tardiphaga sp.]|nr:hypothetical protein [Tardiphaga sp.]
MLILPALMLLVAATAVRAAEPSGCDKFKWPIEGERAALTTSERPLLKSGGELSIPGRAVTVALLPSPEARLPTPAERNFPPDTFAGYVTVAAPKTPGLYAVSLSEALWIDVVQDGKRLKPVAFSGATDCAGLRKTMRFELTAQPLTIQLSGGKADRVNLLLSRAATP